MDFGRGLVTFPPGNPARGFHARPHGVPPWQPRARTSQRRLVSAADNQPIVDLGHAGGGPGGVLGQLRSHQLFTLPSSVTLWPLAETRICVASSSALRRRASSIL